MDNHYKFRITLHPLPQDLVDLLQKDTVSYAAILEGDGQVQAYHYHFYLILQAKEATFRNHLRKCLGTGRSKGNSRFSLQHLDRDVQDPGFAVEYLAYMMKTGIPQLLFNFDPKWLTIAEQYEVDYLENKKQKGSLLKRLTSEVQSHFTESKYGLVDEIDGQVPCPENIVPIVIQFFKTQQTLINKSRIQGYVETLLLQFDPVYPDKLAESIIENLKK